MVLVYTSATPSVIVRGSLMWTGSVEHCVMFVSILQNVLAFWIMNAQCFFLCSDVSRKVVCYFCVVCCNVCHISCRNTVKERRFLKSHFT